MANIEDLRIASPVPKPQGKRKFLLYGTIVVLIILSVAGGITLTYVNKRAVVVEVYIVPAQNPGKSGDITAGGYLEVTPPGPLILSTQIEGRIESVKVIAGQPVEEGEELVRLDSRPLQIELEVLEAKLKQARERLSSSSKEYERNEELFKIGSIPKRVLDASEWAWRDATATAAITEAEVARLQLRLSQCIIQAPVKGTIFEVFAQPGEWVSPTDSRVRPGAILSLIDPKNIQAWVDINQRDINRISIGQTVHISTDAEPNRIIQGRVSRLLPKANLQKNTVQVKIEIPEPTADLRPEMSVNVTFLPHENSSENPDGIAIPVSAVLRERTMTGVYFYVEGLARFREVEVVKESGGRVFLHSGVSPGDQVIMNPQRLSEGQAVKLRK